MGYIQSSNSSVIVNLSGDTIVPKSSTNNQIVLFSYNDRKAFFTGAFVNPDRGLVPTTFDRNLYESAKWNLDLPLDGSPGEIVTIKAWVYDPLTKQFIKLNNELRYKIKA